MSDFRHTVPAWRECLHGTVFCVFTLAVCPPRQSYPCSLHRLAVFYSTCVFEFAKDPPALLPWRSYCAVLRAED